MWVRYWSILWFESAFATPRTRHTSTTRPYFGVHDWNDDDSIQTLAHLYPLRPYDMSNRVHWREEKKLETRRVAQPKLELDFRVVIHESFFPLKIPNSLIPNLP